MPVTVYDIYQMLDSRIPKSLSCDWDHDGLQCARSCEAPVSRVLCCMDVTEPVIAEAEEKGCSLIVSHHPLIFGGLRAVNPQTPAGRRIISLIEKRIAVFSFHTRLDAVEGGVNDTLCRELGLTVTGRFGPEGEVIGRMAETGAPTDFAAFGAHVKAVLGTPALQCVHAGNPVRKVAVLGGAGKDFWEAALSAGADTYLTGEMSYHTLLDAKTAGLNVIAAGHFHTERPVTKTLARWIAEAFPEVETFVSETECALICI